MKDHKSREKDKSASAKCTIIHQLASAKREEQRGKKKIGAITAPYSPLLEED